MKSLPCPFCGREPEIMKVVAEITGRHKYGAYCAGLQEDKAEENDTPCPAYLEAPDWFYEIGLAVKAWNEMIAVLMERQGLERVV